MFMLLFTYGDVTAARLTTYGGNSIPFLSLDAVEQAQMQMK